jgi:tyrosyl-tRNA synthetase
MSNMTLSEELQWRGLIKDRTFDDVRWLDTPRTFYLGSDASADGLTIGNLAIYMLARQLALHGWRAVLLVGGATSLIGDPGGKDEERQLKKQEEIARNIAAVADEVRRIFAGIEFELVNNYDWFKDVGYLQFLREVGKHYSMTELVQRDFIATRMGEGGSGISYAEFSYSLIQGYDYWWLFKNKGVELQIGGSDQWGNMLSGAPLIRKKEGKEVHALSMPLVINKTTGKKFGKSEAGAVWLDPAKTSPTAFYQFWITCDDEGVVDYLKLYTLLGKTEIEELMVRHRANAKERLAQTRLAQEVTRLVHGEQELSIAETVTQVLIGRTSVADLDDAALAAIRTEVPTTHATPGMGIVEVLVQTQLAASKTEARRLIADNAIAINGSKTQKEMLEAADFQNGRLLLRKGKAFKDSALVEQS